MIGRIRGDWQRFEAGKAGFRFRERYRRRKRGRRGGFDPRKAFRSIGAVAIMVVSLLLAPLPGPGWGTFVVGLMILAGELYAVARFLDRVEVKIGRPARRARKVWARSPPALRVLVSVAVPVCGVALGLWALLSVLRWLL